MRKTICGRTRYGNFFFIAASFLLFAVLTACVSASEPSTESIGWVKQDASNKNSLNRWNGLDGFASPVCADSAAKVEIQEQYGKLPLCFIENQGQVHEKVRFYEKGNGHAMFFTEKGVYLTLMGQEEKGRRQQQDARGTNTSLFSKENNGKTGKVARGLKTQNNAYKTRSDSTEIPNSKPRTPDSELQPLNSQLPTPNSELLTSHLVKLIPLGANKHPEIIAEGLQACKMNYFIGNDTEKWKTSIPTYGAVVYKNIYNGIDLKFYGNNRQLEYDVIVKPGADPSRVMFAYEGIEDLRVNENGDLEIVLENGLNSLNRLNGLLTDANDAKENRGGVLPAQQRVIQRHPYVYQEIEGKRVEIEGKFRVLGSGFGVKKPATRNSRHETQNPKHFVYGFHVASYDKQYPLIIDPSIAYSTYLGGSHSDGGNGIAVDRWGNIYVTGATYSSDFPLVNATNGRFKYYEAFVTKISAGGTSTVYSTYLGGSNSDGGTGIAVDSAGNAYVTGYTRSSDFPLVKAIDKSFGGVSEAFITKIDAGGTVTVFSTFLGGSSDDYGSGIAVDYRGNLYVTGFTTSSDFSLVNEIDKSFGWGSEAFITKIDAGGTVTVYSTFLGGSDNDSGNGIAVDKAGNAYVTGRTWSSDFPVFNAIDGCLGGDNDAFVTKINAGGTATVYSTFLGGSGNDSGNGIAVDRDGNAYVTGQTWSFDFPVGSATDRSLGGGNDAFVTKINAGGTATVYSTFLGGSGNDSGNGIAVDRTGNAYVIGQTWSSDFPTVNATNRTLGGSDDAFITKINAGGTVTVYSTYLGGNSSDSGNGIAVDRDGNAYVTGHTFSSTCPCVNALNRSFGGVSDAFITKLIPLPSDIFTSAGSITITGVASYANSATVTTNLSATGAKGYTISEDSAIPPAADAGWASLPSTTSYSVSGSHTLSSGER